jgi:hypothetical protein
MKIYLDTEFNGFAGELISMAMVAEDGKEWYETLIPTTRYTDWVQANVFPVLGKDGIFLSEFRASFLKFIRWFDRPTVICDWYSDAIHFFKLFDGPTFEKSTSFEGAFCVVRTPPGEPKSLVPHNALEDARALKIWHEGQL